MQPLHGIALITTKRDDLIAISRLLTELIDPRFFRRASRPLIVSINGSYNSGKSAVPDTMRALYLTGTTEMSPDDKPDEGERDRHEIWRGAHNGSDIEIHYSDLGCTDSQEVKEAAGKRRNGGLTFLQNNTHRYSSPDTKPDIEIWIEKQGAGVIFGEDRAENGPLSSAFNDASPFFGSRDWKKSWVRYVEINVAATGCIDFSRLSDALQKLYSGAVYIARSLPHNGKREEFVVLPRARNPAFAAPPKRTP